MPTVREWVRRKTAELEWKSENYHDKVTCTLGFVAAFENVVRPTVGPRNISFAFGHPVNLSSGPVTPDLVIILHGHLVIAEICYAKSHGKTFEEQVQDHSHRLQSYSKIRPEDFGMPSGQYTRGVALIVPEDRAADAVAVVTRKLGDAMAGAILGHLFDREPQESIYRLHLGTTGHILLDGILAQQRSISVRLAELEGRDYRQVRFIDESPPDACLLHYIWNDIYTTAKKEQKRFGGTIGSGLKISVSVAQLTENLRVFYCIPPTYRLGVERPPIKTKTVRYGLRLLERLGLGRLEDDDFELKLLTKNPRLTKNLGKVLGKDARQNELNLQERLKSLAKEQKEVSKALEKELDREGKKETVIKDGKKLTGEQLRIYRGESEKTKSLRKQQASLNTEMANVKAKLEKLLSG